MKSILCPEYGYLLIILLGALIYGEKLNTSLHKLYKKVLAAYLFSTRQMGKNICRFIAKNQPMYGSPYISAQKP